MGQMTHPAGFALHEEEDHVEDGEDQLEDDVKQAEAHDGPPDIELACADFHQDYSRSGRPVSAWTGCERGDVAVRLGRRYPRGGSQARGLVGGGASLKGRRAGGFSVVIDQGARPPQP